MTQVKISCEMIGMTQLASEWGLVMKGNIFADSSAALGIAVKIGMTKHVNRQTLDKMAALLQQHFKEGRAQNSLHLQTASG